jgi:hypothetical protein
MKASYSASESGSVASSFSAGSRRRNGGCTRLRAFRIAPLLLLAEDALAHVPCWRWGRPLGPAPKARAACALASVGHGFRSIFTDQCEEFTDLPRERAIGIGQPFEICVRGRAEQGDEALLRGRAFRGGHLCAELFLKTFGPQGLSAMPRAGISGDLVVLIINGDGGGVRFDSELRAHIARRHAVPVAVER